MNKQISIILTEECHDLLTELQELIAKKEMVKTYTQAQVITKALIVLKDKIDNEAGNEK